MEKLAIKIKDIEKKLLPLINDQTNDQTNGYKVQKCRNSSTYIRNEGNKLYNLSHHDKNIHLEIFKCYTKCIAYAPSGSEELATGYSNRSMLLFHLGQYKSCITDVDRALAITQSKWLRIKLLIRKVDCVAMGQLYLCDEYKNLDLYEILNKGKFLVNELGGNNIKIKDSLNELIKKAEESVKNSYNKGTDGREYDARGKAQFPNFDRKGEIPCSSDSLALRYNDEFGRHLTAVRDIKAGEILIIEDGFVHPNPADPYMTCSHCVEGTHSGIPCDTCVFAVYCSLKCKEDAWTSYHDKECCKYDYRKILEVFMKPETDDFGQFSVYLMLLRRILVYAIKKTDKSVNNLYSKFFGVDKVNQDKRTRGFMNNDGLDGLTLEAVGSLVSHIDEEAVDYVFLPFVYMLSVDVLPFESDSDFRMMLHLVTQAMNKFFANSHGVGLDDCFCICKTEWHGVDHQDDCVIRRGIMLAPFCSLINHSCVNNARYEIVNGNMVVFAERPIKAGEQICIDYGMAQLEKTASQRRHNISLKYNFMCTCQACKENWPVITVEKSREENQAGFLEFVRKLKNLKKVDQVELTPKYMEAIKNKLGVGSVENLSLVVGVDLIKDKIRFISISEYSRNSKLIFLFKMDKMLHVASETIHDLYKKNTLRTFMMKSELIRTKLRSLILCNLLCYDKNHYDISDNCSKNSSS